MGRTGFFTKNLRKKYAGKRTMMNVSFETVVGAMDSALGLTDNAADQSTSAHGGFAVPPRIPGLLWDCTGRVAALCLGGSHRC
jgi:hypothetical protein